MTRPFFSTDPATTEIYTLSLHDALPISHLRARLVDRFLAETQHQGLPVAEGIPTRDRKSTRLNSSHVEISYAVFCLKKKMLSTTASTTHGTRANCSLSSRSSSRAFCSFV